MSATSIHRYLLHRGLSANEFLYRILLTANRRWLRLQWTFEHRTWETDWHQVVFSDESRFNLRDHGDRIRVRRYADQRCLPECVIDRHNGRTAGVMAWSAISCHKRSNLLSDNLNSNRYVYEVLQLKLFPSFKASLERSFRRIMHARNVAKTFRDFCSAQHMQFLPWLVYPSDMLPIEQVWHLVGRRLARDPWFRELD